MNFSYKSWYSNINRSHLAHVPLVQIAAVTGEFGEKGQCFLISMIFCISHNAMPFGWMEHFISNNNGNDFIIHINDCGDHRNIRSDKVRVTETESDAKEKQTNGNGQKPKFPFSLESRRKKMWTIFSVFWFNTFQFSLFPAAPEKRFPFSWPTFFSCILSALNSAFQKPLKKSWNHFADTFWWCSCCCCWDLFQFFFLRFHQRYIQTGVINATIIITWQKKASIVEKICAIYLIWLLVRFVPSQTLNINVLYSSDNFAIVWNAKNDKIRAQPTITIAWRFCVCVFFYFRWRPCIRFIVIHLMTENNSLGKHAYLRWSACDSKSHFKKQPNQTHKEPCLNFGW